MRKNVCGGGGGKGEATWRRGNKEGGITREDKDRAK